jgi:L-lactate dehydrogenase complex protein LldG
MSRSAREDMLAAIRTGNGGSRLLAEAESAWLEIPRRYEVSKSEARESLLALFESRLKDYDAEVRYCTEEGVTGAVMDWLKLLGVTRLVVPNGIDGVDLLSLARGGVQLMAGDGATPAELDAVEAVLTWSTLGIAETGSLVLQNVAGQGARAVSLVPDTHLCMVRQESVVATVPEAIRTLALTDTVPTTFVSGPSATADIEMTRIKGVHGPRFLYVLIVR